MILDYKYILKILPHRYPFLLLDKLVFEPEEGGKTKIMGVKNVTFNEPFFKGHFDNDPVMPGVLIIEAAAQSALVGFVCLQMQQNNQSLEQILNTNVQIKVRFGSMDEVRFRKEVRPGAVLNFYVELINKRINFAKFKVIVKDSLLPEGANVVAEVILGAWLL